MQNLHLALASGGLVLFVVACEVLTSDDAALGPSQSLWHHQTVAIAGV